MTGTDIWQTSMVTLAFQHPFLLSMLFSISALHLVSLHTAQDTTRGQEYSRAATIHYLKSILDFRSGIQSLTPENSDACCACALLLAFHAWTSPSGEGADLFFPRDTQVPWYKLHRGGVEVVKFAARWLEKGEMRGLVRPWDRVLPSTLPQTLTSASVVDNQEADHRRLDNIASCWNQTDSILPSDDRLTLDETLDSLRYVFILSSLLAKESSFASEISINSCFATFLWTTIVPSRFCEMAEERCPQALIVVAVYCVLLKRAEGLWWMSGKAESLLIAVRRELRGEEWNEWLDWPMMEINGNKKAFLDGVEVLETVKPV